MLTTSSIIDIKPFSIEVKWLGLNISAEVRPCCKEEDVVDYAIWSDGKLQFTITKDPENDKWVVAMINADKHTNDEFIQAVGEQIEKKLA